MVATNPHLQGEYQEVLSDVAIRATKVYIFQWVALFLSAFFIRSFDAAVLWLVAGASQMMIYIIMQQAHSENIEVLAVMIFQEWILMVYLSGKFLVREIYFLGKLAFDFLRGV
jgi:predicted cation transporter